MNFADVDQALHSRGCITRKEYFKNPRKSLSAISVTNRDVMNHINNV